MRNLFVAAAAVAALAGCGSTSHNVFAVRIGMTQSEVHQKAGSPIRILEHRSFGAFPRRVVNERCWFYRAHQKHTSLLGLDFCFNKRGRVNWIEHDVTLGTLLNNA